jgi:hypothetical protein
MNRCSIGLRRPHFVRAAILSLALYASAVSAQSVASCGLPEPPPKNCTTGDAAERLMCSTMYDFRKELARPCSPSGGVSGTIIYIEVEPDPETDTEKEKD